MPVICRETVQHYIDVGEKARDAKAKGNALEDLVCYVCELVPGVRVTNRNELDTLKSEEIDVALWNMCCSDGLYFLPNTILIECKNCAARVGSGEIAVFVEKLRSRGVNFGMLVTTSGITGDAKKMTSAYRKILDALRDGQQLIVVRTSELASLKDTAGFVDLVQKKLGALLVKRAVE